MLGPGRYLMECHRCGWCGQPTDRDGNILELWQVAVLNPFVDWEKAESTPGDCCREGQERQMVQVTHDMAIDGCCPEMEGAWIEW